jgi:hypothetical protein
MTEATKEEKMMVILVFGILSIISLLDGNYVAGAGFASALAIYYLSREGV